MMWNFPGARAPVACGSHWFFCLPPLILKCALAPSLPNSIYRVIFIGTSSLLRELLSEWENPPPCLLKHLFNYNTWGSKG